MRMQEQGGMIRMDEKAAGGRFGKAEESVGRESGLHVKRKRLLRKGIGTAGKWFAAALAAGFFFLLCGSRAQALELKEGSERPESYQLFYLNGDTFLYEEADETSTVLRELKKMEMVVPVEIGVPWMKVSIGGITGYIKSAFAQQESPDPAVAQEMEEQAAYDVELINEIGRLTAEQKRSRVYGIIIICMIVGIFAAGIASTVVRKKGEGNEKGLEPQDAPLKSRSGK